MRILGPVIALSVLFFLGLGLWNFHQQLEARNGSTQNKTFTQEVLSLFDDTSSVPLGKGTPSAYTQALRDSATSSKPVILIFSAHWCGPCQYMKKEVYPSRPVQSIANKFIWLYFDVDDTANRPLAEKFGVQGIPAIFVVDSNGHVKNQQVGSSNPDQFTYFLSATLPSHP